MVDKEEIIEILKRHPSGLKAKDIAILICGADRKTVNQILYANPSSFSCNANYEWTLLSKTAPVMQKTPKPIVAVDSARRIDREVSQDYKNYYLAIDQGSFGGKSTKLKLYLLGDSDYIIQSDSKNIACPFCHRVFSIRSFDCHNCGHTMHEICEKLYSQWNIDGHRFRLTWRPVDDYPVSERSRKVYEAVRQFVVESLPYFARDFFKNIIYEVHLNTLVVIYQRSLGRHTAEEEVNEEIDVETKRLRKKLLDAPQSDSELRVMAKQCLEKAYANDVLIDYDACKLYLAYMAILHKSTSMKFVQNMVTLKLYGDLELNGDTIYQTVQISTRDTIESTAYLRSYHKECEHSCEKVYLRIPLLLPTGELIMRTLLGTYCDKCKKYFVLDTEFKKILCEGQIQARISFSESGAHCSGMDLSAESLLRKCGYTVNANSKATKEQRQKLLQAIVENKLYTPAKIIAHFRFLIAMNSNVVSRDMRAAISKWQEDMLFLQQRYG